MNKMEEKAISLFELLSETQRHEVLKLTETMAYDNVIKYVKENPGISEKELYRFFPDMPSDVISNIVCDSETVGEVMHSEKNNLYISAD